MKNLMISMIVIYLFVGCHKETDKETDKETEKVNVSLIVIDDPEFFKKSVFLVDNKDYLVKTNLAIFQNEYPFNSVWGYDQKIKPKLIIDGEKLDSLNLGNYILYNFDSIYVVAHYFETGKCLVYDKKSHLILKQLELEKFIEGSPMAMTMGRRFYIKNKLYLEVEDMISK